MDYAFIPYGMRGVLSATVRRILVRAPVTLSASMSLYRAGIELASFLPLGVAIASWP